MILSTYFPQKLLTRLIGWVANIEWPPLKNPLIRLFIWLYKIDLSIVLEKNPLHYRSLNDFFIRQLQPQKRPLAENPLAWLSPADGRVGQFGTITGTTLIQAKGKTYSLTSLLATDTTTAKPFVDGQFITIYLAPHNYHRVHMPLTGRLQRLVYVPGKLFPVNPKSVERTRDLFGRNERVICYFTTDHGPMVVIFVGALNVGSIHITGHGLVTPPYGKAPCEWAKTNQEYQRGEELGYFKMGSTVIVLFPKNQATFLTTLQHQQMVKFGEALGTVV